MLFVQPNTALYFFQLNNFKRQKKIKSCANPSTKRHSKKNYPKLSNIINLIKQPLPLTPKGGNPCNAKAVNYKGYYVKQPHSQTHATADKQPFYFCLFNSLFFKGKSQKSKSCLLPSNKASGANKSKNPTHKAFDLLFLHLLKSNPPTNPDHHPKERKQE